MSSKKSNNGGSLKRVVLLRLIKKWRRRADDCERALGATIDAVGREHLETRFRAVRLCARELEAKLAQQNVELSDSRPTKT